MGDAVTNLVVARPVPVFDVHANAVGPSRL
jgi:hypothetical protein